MASAFGLNGLSFVAVICALAAMRAEGLPGLAQGTSVREDIWAGLRYAAQTPLVALTLSLLSTVGPFVINHNVLVPLLARDVLHEGAHGFGLLMAAVGVGAIGGALAVATRGAGRPPLSRLLGTASVASALTVLLAVIQNFWAAVLVLTLVGLAQIVFLASCNTLLQLVVPDRMRGRIMSLYAFVWIVNAAPLTDATKGMVNTQFFAVLKPTAIFINVARGGSVVTADLVDALKRKKLAGAGLDVTDPEPLPDGHPLFSAPNVIITPPVAARADVPRERLEAVVKENVRRYVAGDKMLSVVNQERGY